MDYLTAGMIVVVVLLALAFANRFLTAWERSVELTARAREMQARADELRAEGDLQRRNYAAMLGAKGGSAPRRKKKNGDDDDDDDEIDIDPQVVALAQGAGIDLRAALASPQGFNAAIARAIEVAKNAPPGQLPGEVKYING